MPIYVLIRDLKNTSSLVERENDVTVTKNGYEAIHCLSVNEYQMLQDEKAKAKLLSRVLLAEEGIKNEIFIDYEVVFKETKARYSL